MSFRQTASGRVSDMPLDGASAQGTAPRLGLRVTACVVTGLLALTLAAPLSSCQPHVQKTRLEAVSALAVTGENAGESAPEQVVSEETGTLAEDALATSANAQPTCADATCAESASDGSQPVASVEVGPYYNLLAAQEQNQYLVIAHAVEQGHAEVTVPGALDDEVLTRVLGAIHYDRPDLFWFNGSATGSITETESVLTLGLSAQGADLAAQRAAFDARVAEVLEPLAGLSPVEQEKAVHDFLARHVAYAGDGPDAGQSAYGALVEGRGVCAGYARAFQLLMTRLGVPCNYISGEAQGTQQFEEGAWMPHAWNTVQLGGQWYNVDVTWDDGTLLNQDAILYTNFNLTDDVFQADHARSEVSSGLPYADGGAFDFEGSFGASRMAAAAASVGAELFGTASSAEGCIDLLSQAAWSAPDYHMVLYLGIQGRELAGSLTGLWQDPVSEAFEARGYQGTITFNVLSQEVGTDTYIARVEIG